MHNAAFEMLGQPHRYLPFHVTPEGLPAAVTGMWALGFGGVNLTVPHKRAALALVDEVVGAAARLGAINTLVRGDRGWRGHNTDGAGFMAGLGELQAQHGLQFPQRVMVLGGGGAARAIVDALLHASPPVEVVWVSRDPDRLPRWPGCIRASYDAIASAMKSVHVLVNGTTVGMKGGPVAFPRSLPLDRLPNGAMAVDIVYPRPSGGWLDAAASLGVATQDGLPMLLWQGVKAQELWQGDVLPHDAVSAMRSALLQ